MAYTVTAPLVIAADEQGSRHHLYQGAPVPDSIAKDEVKRLADAGLIADESKAKGNAPSAK